MLTKLLRVSLRCLCLFREALRRAPLRRTGRAPSFVQRLGETSFVELGAWSQHTCQCSARLEFALRGVGLGLTRARAHTGATGPSASASFPDVVGPMRAAVRERRL